VFAGRSKGTRPVGFGAFVDCGEEGGERGSRVALAREKLEYDVATACLMHKIEMDRICEDKSMDDGERIQAIRESCLGRTCRSELNYKELCFASNFRPSAAVRFFGARRSSFICNSQQQ